MKPLILMCLISGFLVAMEESDETKPLNNIISVSIVKREDMGNPFWLDVQDSATIGCLKKAIAENQNIPVERIILRALPRHTGSVASYILSDHASVITLVSLYSNRFLWSKAN